jgi:hypothetical protein
MAADKTPLAYSAIIFLFAIAVEAVFLYI